MVTYVKIHGNEEGIRYVCVPKVPCTERILSEALWISVTGIRVGKEYV